MIGNSGRIVHVEGIGIELDVLKEIISMIEWKQQDNFWQLADEDYYDENPEERTEIIEDNIALGVAWDFMKRLCDRYEDVGGVL